MIKMERPRDFAVKRLYPQLFYATAGSHRELSRRYSPGTVRRLGADAITALDTVKDMVQWDHEHELHTSGRATLIAVDDDPPPNYPEAAGIATVMKGLQVHIRASGLMPMIANHVPNRAMRQRETTNLGNFNITGWVFRPVARIAESMTVYGDKLTVVYKDLRARVPREAQVWTVEPCRSHPVVHRAIIEAGMIPLGEPAYYDVGEYNGAMIPVSQAYVGPGLTS